MAASTVLQLIEVVIAAAIVFVGVWGGSATVAVLGGGFLVGIAITSILAPEGGTIYRRASIGYVIAGLFVLGGFVAFHFKG